VIVSFLTYADVGGANEQSGIWRLRVLNGLERETTKRKPDRLDESKQTASSAPADVAGCKPNSSRWKPGHVKQNELGPRAVWGALVLANTSC